LVDQFTLARSRSRKDGREAGLSLFCLNIQQYSIILIKTNTKAVSSTFRRDGFSYRKNALKAQSRKGKEMNWSISWTFLLLAIVFETIGTSAMKMSQGFTRIGPAVVMVVCYVLCFSLLTL
jgi:hypothetical protein